MPKIPAPESRQAEYHPNFAMGASETRLASGQQIFLFSAKAIEFSKLPSKEICRLVDLASGVVPDFLYKPFFHYFGDFWRSQGMGC